MIIPSFSLFYKNKGKQFPAPLITSLQNYCLFSTGLQIDHIRFDVVS